MIPWAGFKQPEPERRRPPRQLRSRTIGSISWDSNLGYRPYDMGEGIVQEEIQEPLPTKPQISWYSREAKKGWTDHIRNLLHDPRPVGEESRSTERDAVVATSTVEEFTSVPSNHCTGRPWCRSWNRFVCQCCLNISEQKMDILERQFQKWYSSLMLGLGKHLENVNSSMEAIYQMGLSKREHKRNEYQTQRIQQKPGIAHDIPSHKSEEECKQPIMVSGMQPWTAWISQVRLNEQEVPEYFRTSDAMKHTVEIVEDDEVIQTTTCHTKTKGYRERSRRVETGIQGWTRFFRQTGCYEFHTSQLPGHNLGGDTSM